MLPSRLEVGAHAHREDGERLPEVLLGLIAQLSQPYERRRRIALCRTHRHQALQVEQPGRGRDHVEGVIRVCARFLRLARDVDLHENPLRRSDASQGLGEPHRVNRLDQPKPARGLAHLIGLQVADEMPLRARKELHFVERLMDPVLAQHVQAGVERPAARRDVEAFGDGDDGDVAWIASRPNDALADLGQVLSNAQRIATMAPNRVPSGWRR